MTDDIDQVLIAALMEDSRCSLKALAQISGLSSPACLVRLGNPRRAGRDRVLATKSVRDAVQPSFAWSSEAALYRVRTRRAFRMLQASLLDQRDRRFLPLLLRQAPEREPEQIAPRVRVEPLGVGADDGCP